MATVTEAVEIALRGARLTPEAAQRLHTIIESRIIPPTARDRLDDYLEQAVMPDTVRQNVQRLVRGALAEQASQVLNAADKARREVGLKSSAEHVYEAVRQALLSDRPEG